MSEQGVTRFLEALRSLERHGDLEPIVAVFAEGAVVGNVMQPEAHTGPEAVRRFWKTYRESFRDVASSFRNVIRKGERVALEWHSTGHNLRGVPVAYDGVSVLELDEHDRVRRFWAYFDPGRLSDGAARPGSVIFHREVNEDLVRETP